MMNIIASNTSNFSILQVTNKITDLRNNNFEYNTRLSKARSLIRDQSMVATSSEHVKSTAKTTKLVSKTSSRLSKSRTPKQTRTIAYSTTTMAEKVDKRSNNIIIEKISSSNTKNIEADQVIVVQAPTHQPTHLTSASQTGIAMQNITVVVNISVPSSHQQTTLTIRTNDQKIENATMDGCDDDKRNERNECLIINYNDSNHGIDINSSGRRDTSKPNHENKSARRKLFPEDDANQFKCDAINVRRLRTFNDIDADNVDDPTENVDTCKSFIILFYIFL